ncbi:MAG: hypothetical protein MUO26_02275 [Methanotrichaceae archaeon]|nr:hypothetical protein [Methanotrichaceae archaeon]
MSIDDEMREAKKKVDEELSKALGANVLDFMEYMDDTFGIEEDEEGISDINFTDEQREQAIEYFVNVLEKKGIEKTCAIIHLMLSRKDLTILALGRAILDIDRHEIHFKETRSSS